MGLTTLSWMAWLRQRYVIAGAVALALMVTAVVVLLTPKHWESTATVHIEPLQVAGLRSDEATLPTPEAAVAAEVAMADGEPFRSAVLDGFDYPVSYQVTGDESSGSLSFVVQGDSAERAFFAAYGIANGYLAWGRAMEAGGRVAELQYEIDRLRQGGEPTEGEPPIERLEAVQAARQAALDQMGAVGGTVSGVPQIPDDPASPRVVVWFLVAGLGGLAAGLALAWWRERRSPAEHRAAAERLVPRPAGRQRVGRIVLGTLVIALPGLIGASALAGVISVWELRPSTAANDEQQYRCLERWAKAVPDGSAVAVDSDVAFFRDHFEEFAFPRLTLVGPDQHADVVLRIVPGPGPKECGGYHLEPTGP